MGIHRAFLFLKKDPACSGLAGAHLASVKLECHEWDPHFQPASNSDQLEVADWEDGDHQFCPLIDVWPWESPEPDCVKDAIELYTNQYS